MPAPGSLVDGVYYPDPAGSWAPRPLRHTHIMRIVTWTLEGPLKVYVGCAFCAKGAVVKPSRRIRKIPEGFTPATWAKFLDRGDARAEAEKEKAA